MPEVLNEPSDLSPLDETHGEALRFEEPVKLKGRKRFIQSLQRISSSPSLARMGRVPSSSYRTGGKASMSCVSLASNYSAYASSHQNHSSSQTSVGFSTAPTSVVTTPGPESQTFDFDSRIRIISQSSAGQVGATPLTAPLPAEARTISKEAPLPTALEVPDGYTDCSSRPLLEVVPERKLRTIDFWGEMPYEIKVHIFRFLKPREIIRCSAVSRSWHEMCFDGQLWAELDTQEYYRDIPSMSLVRLMTAAGPFVRDLNLRGCHQLWDRWATHGQAMAEACRNLQSFSLEDCRIDLSSVHHFLLQNTRLVHVNFCRVPAVSNSAMRIIAQGCPLLESLNVSWCPHLDTQGLHKIIESCTNLKELRASETKGWDDKNFLSDIFKRNMLQRLFIDRSDADDESLQVLFQGRDPEVDPLTGQAIVPTRNFRHLNLSRCTRITDKGIKYMSQNVPLLAGLQVSQLVNLTDGAFKQLFEDTPLLTHLDMEQIDDITNSTLQKLAQSPCTPVLQHLNISYCENLGDTGMLPIIKNCPGLRSVQMDNTRVSDLVLAEAAAQVRLRDQPSPNRPPTTFTPQDPIPPTTATTSSPQQHQPQPPKIALHLEVYDCQNITWTGIREIMSRNSSSLPRPHQHPHPHHQHQHQHQHQHRLINLKCFYGYQPTFDEHLKRLQSNKRESAERLERKWAEYMVASEEAGAGGAGARRRRRRAREAAVGWVDEEEGGGFGGGGLGMGFGGVGRGGRRRARSGGACVVM
ncbi:MAG: hypothetical protein LQ350_007021 [Teloschistes chrysophthalmus]|nr:MAG: hypothetical protein LQ350_007021 [Niorma chrysophthalma]